MTVALTIDVEQENNFKSSKEDGLYNCLDLLKECGVSATFFVTGRYAETHPDETKEIVKSGHEIANHSYSHKLLASLNDREVAREIILADWTLVKITNKLVYGFRSPFNSPTPKVYETLKNIGYAYDSSIHPTHIPFRYNYTKFPPHPFLLNNVFEIPSSVTPKYRLPIGWLWARNLGIRYVKFCANNIIKKGFNVVFYAHNWEFADISHNKNISWIKRRNTGKKFCITVSEFVKYLQNREQSFLTMFELSKKLRKERLEWKNYSL